jgi:hypothetical protein
MTTQVLAFQSMEPQTDMTKRGIRIEKPVGSESESLQNSVHKPIRLNAFYILLLMFSYVLAVLGLCLFFFIR